MSAAPNAFKRATEAIYFSDSCWFLFARLDVALACALRPSISVAARSLTRFANKHP